MLPFWTIWCRTLGNKISDEKTVADKAAYLRTGYIVIQVMTCLFIMAGIIRHWNDGGGTDNPKPMVCIGTLAQ